VRGRHWSYGAGYEAVDGGCREGCEGDGHQGQWSAVCLCGAHGFVSKCVRLVAEVRWTDGKSTSDVLSDSMPAGSSWNFQQPHLSLGCQQSLRKFHILRTASD
jgi:hypothetical protein